MRDSGRQEGQLRGLQEDILATHEEYRNWRRQFESIGSLGKSMLIANEQVESGRNDFPRRVAARFMLGVHCDDKMSGTDVVPYCLLVSEALKWMNIVPSRSCDLSSINEQSTKPTSCDAEISRKVAGK